MAKVLITEDYLSDIGDAIRGKLGGSTQYTPRQMASAISRIPTVNPTLVSKSIVANGTYDAEDDDADGYDSVSVNVPNSYSASDEGKVVSNGNLLAQTTKQITVNGTHDTTTNNSVAVDVPNSYTASDNGKVVVNQALVAQTSKNINANGTHDTTANNSVVVDVPNSYAAADEGKVVSSGALVSQTSATITENGTYDTTLNDEVTVNVSGGGGSGTLIPKIIVRNGSYDPADDNADGYSSVTVAVKSADDGPLIPVMTSNTTPSGIASASSYLMSNFEAFRAFNGTDAQSSMQQGWLASGSDNAPWLAYSFGRFKQFDYVVIRTANNGASDTRTVEIQGQKSDDSWENCLGSGSTTTLTFTQGTYGTSSVEHIIPLNGNEYKAIKIIGNEPFYMGVNQTACTFGQVQVYTAAESFEVAELLTRSEWDALTTAQKQAKGLVAIQDYSTGFNRGVLVNGSDYVPES